MTLKPPVRAVLVEQLQFGRVSDDSSPETLGGNGSVDPPSGRTGHRTAPEASYAIFVHASR